MRENKEKGALNAIMVRKNLCKNLIITSTAWQTLKTDQILTNKDNSNKDSLLQD